MPRTPANQNTCRANIGTKTFARASKNTPKLAMRTRRGPKNQKGLRGDTVLQVGFQVGFQAHN